MGSGPLSSKKVPVARFSRLICVVMTCFGLWRVGVSRFSGDQFQGVCLLYGVYYVHSCLYWLLIYLYSVY